MIPAWLQARSVQVQEGTPRDKLVQLAQQTLENPSMCFLRDKAKGEDDRRAVLEVWHADVDSKLPWLHRIPVPASTAPFSSTFCSFSFIST